MDCKKCTIGDKQWKNEAGNARYTSWSAHVQA